MKPAKVAGTCLIVAVVLSGACASLASAEAPEFGQCLKKAVPSLPGFSDSKCTKEATTENTGKYEWLPGAVAGANKFTTSGSTVLIETAGGKKMKCSGENGSGEYSLSNSKQLTSVFVEFSGCETAGIACTTAGKAEGQLAMRELVGEVGFEKEDEGITGKKTVLKLSPGPSAEGLVIVFKCFGETVEWRGTGGAEGAGILVPIKNNRMFASEDLKYVQSKGDQKPSKWAGMPAETFLEWSNEKTTFEELGWIVTMHLANEGGQQYELNAAV